MCVHVCMCVCVCTKLIHVVCAHENDTNHTAHISFTTYSTDQFNLAAYRRQTQSSTGLQWPPVDVPPPSHPVPWNRAPSFEMTL